MEGRLKDYKSKVFKDEILSARKNLPNEFADSFFKGTMIHFLEEIPMNTGTEILKTFSIIFRKSGYLSNYFIDNCYIYFLPFFQKNLTDALCDTIYELVSRDIDIFDRLFCDLFFRIVIRRPNKALIIIFKVLENFNNRKCQQNILKVLLHGSRYFSTPISGKEYSRLLNYLVFNYPYIIDYHGQYIYHAAVDLLSADDPEIINVTYYTLSKISEYCFDIDSYCKKVPKNRLLKHKKLNFCMSVPFHEVSAHIHYKEICDSALDFLLVTPVLSSDDVPTYFILSLLTVAEWDSRATMVLMQLSEDINVASYLVKIPSWMCVPLPTSDMTLKLFMVIFKIGSIRRNIASCEYYADFLNNTLKSADLMRYQLAAKIFRRTQLDADMINYLSRRKVIANFLVAAEMLRSVKANYIAITVIDTVQQYCLSREIIPFSTLISHEICNNGPNLEAALKLAIELCQYERCCDHFVNLKLDKHIYVHLSFIKYQKLAKRLLEAIRYGKK